MLKKLLSIVSLFSAISTSYAATLIVNGGILEGASDVNVNGSLYDVYFMDGSCVSLYNGCDDQPDFLFTDNDSASAASAALLEQVFIGIYDDDPELTRGCTYDTRCRVRTAYGLFLNDQVNAHAAVNSRLGAVLGDTFTNGVLDILEDTTTMDNRTMAVWSHSEVPAPAAAWLFGSALLGLAGMNRKK